MNPHYTTVIHQLTEDITFTDYWKQPEPLESRIRLPHAPQFFVEVAEAVANWLISLFKLGEKNQEKKCVIRTITVDREKFAEAISKHICAFSERDRPKYVLVGRDVFYGLIGELHHQIRFNVEMRSWNTRFRCADCWDVRVICIPWMNGILALPDLTEEMK